MEVIEIVSQRAMGLVMDFHYSQRVVGCRKAFGLLAEGELVGCCCFSMPASYTLCKGVCGEEFKQHVLELSRLVVISERKNAASFLIGQSLRRLGNGIVVSYADGNQHVGHVGYVYQATNWLYTGLSSAEPAWVDPLTGKIVSYTRRWIDKKAAAMGLDWRALKRQPMQGKHRYVTFTGSRSFKKAAMAALRYKTFAYPKGPTRRFNKAVVHHAATLLID